MNAELSNSEMETIAKMVSNKLYDRFVADGSQKELQKASEEYTKALIQFYLSENAVIGDVEKMVVPVLKKYIEKSNAVEDKLKSYMNTKDFKKIELRHLEQRCTQIKNELSNEEENED